MNLIFDIGFNRGDFTEVAFDKYPNARVIGVEANSNLANYGRQRFQGKNIEVLNNLVSDSEEDKVDFYISGSDGISTASKDFIENSRFTKGSKNLKPNSGRWNSPIKIDTISIDEMIERYGEPDFIKVDVEGYEYNVLHSLSKKVGVISFEWHEEDIYTLNQTINHLIELGYFEFGIVGYFDEGDIFPKVTYSDKGDPYLTYPENFYSLDELDLHLLINPERRVNYGMFFAK